MYRGRRYCRAVEPNKTEAQVILDKAGAQIREDKFFDIDGTSNVRFSEIAEDFGGILQGYKEISQTRSVES